MTIAPVVRRARTLGALAAVALLLSVAAACSGDDAANPGGGPDGTAAGAGSGAGSGAGGGGNDLLAPVGGTLTREAVDASFGTLDRMVAEVMETSGAPGVAVAVVYDDEVLYEKGFGVREVGTDEAVDPETVFQIASLSKPISSTVMAGLVGDEVFDWDDPVEGYAPQYALNDAWVSEHVTFADLFAHRSGLPGGPSGNDLEGIGFDRQTILERLALVPLDGFRDIYSYSNWAMTLGGEVAGIAAGSDWETVSEDVLFGPAGMASTSMRYDDLVANPNRAELHSQVDGEWVAAVTRDPEPQAPAGGVSTNVVDLARWMRLQLGSGTLDGEELIDADALAATHVPHITSRPPMPPDGGQPGFYGLGWALATEFDGYVTWGHAGAFSDGASTMAKLIPSEGLGIVVLTNVAPFGVPEAITDAYLDYLLTGRDDVDAWYELWNQRMTSIFGDPLDVAALKADATPAAAPEAYVGVYASDYIGEVRITAGADGTLEMALGPEESAKTYTLEHATGDTFVYLHAKELPEFLDTAIFDVVDGRAVSLTLSAMDGAGLGTVQRTGT